VRSTPRPLTDPDGRRIETDRLDLRPLTAADLGALHELNADPGAMRYAGGATCSVDESEARLRRLIEHHERHGFSLWAVVERASGNVIGDAGLVLLEFRGPEIELAYRLKSPVWGKGYATEAAAAWVAYGFDELALARIVAVTDPDNVASQRVLEKVGMRFERMTSYDGARVRLYGIQRSPAG
jgi:ribosomal-protein-alanine N-acetyltransferase